MEDLSRGLQILLRVTWGALEYSLVVGWAFQ